MFWLLLLFSYLLGSVSFAILLSKVTGKTDPRSLGSGNPGATNMMRVAGMRLAVFTLIGDLIKGILPVFIAKQLDFTLEQQAWIGIGAVIGHLYPIYFRFKGGKGVATAAGMVLAVSPIIGMIAIIAWGITFYFTRTSSLSALLALAVMTMISILFEHTILLPILVLCVLILWRHRRNLRDLIAGRERHF
ncbi:glycerol-3-phosphate 1-O-acyltransferase PlsY [Entomomonas sp. E2T0]|uniref:glycerol-3-phosphate 1-O-acyltransferase PlsY n=1 Tax=Entomomonas sp. E2T0 TaxID=2930213 RepID=UPI0022284FFD|nr:glycerol-3-phosphate 1-O-acyltransferase PlsY [Entomomonas sp. E2T0]UYZ83907.1 glycerol-3-phosphate 1-O-acyltransferase PlsY [Entomomonas sp. E2T0]